MTLDDPNPPKIFILENLFKFFFKIFEKRVKGSSRVIMVRKSYNNILLLHHYSLDDPFDDPLMTPDDP